MFFATHWKAVYLWYELMLKYWLYSQKQVGKGNNLCCCAKSFARQPIQTTSFSSLMRNYFYQFQKTNSQNNRYQCSDPKDVPIVLHTQGWLKANLMNRMVEGNVAPQLTRL